jgi:hypothetical protein
MGLSDTLVEAADLNLKRVQFRNNGLAGKACAGQPEGDRRLSFSDVGEIDLFGEPSNHV